MKPLLPLLGEDWGSPGNGVSAASQKTGGGQGASDRDAVLQGEQDHRGLDHIALQACSHGLFSAVEWVSISPPPPPTEHALLLFQGRGHRHREDRHGGKGGEQGRRGHPLSVPQHQLLLHLQPPDGWAVSGEGEE